MPKYTLDTLKHIVSFLDWTCDLETFESISKILKLKPNEKQQILIYWKSETKFRTTINDNGTCFKSVNRKIHCDNGPAVKYANGDKMWFVNGYLHREDGPAYITDLSRVWVCKDKKHRANGLPAVINVWSKEWWENGNLHRIDGPAIEYVYDGKEWFIDGIRHRTDGPAVEWNNGHKEYWLNGVQVSRFTFWFRKITKQI